MRGRHAAEAAAMGRRLSPPRGRDVRAGVEGAHGHPLQRGEVAQVRQEGFRGSLPASGAAGFGRLRPQAHVQEDGHQGGIAALLRVRAAQGSYGSDEESDVEQADDLDQAIRNQDTGPIIRPHFPGAAGRALNPTGWRVGVTPLTWPVAAPIAEPLDASPPPALLGDFPLPSLESIRAAVRAEPAGSWSRALVEAQEMNILDLSASPDRLEARVDGARGGLHNITVLQDHPLAPGCTCSIRRNGAELCPHGAGLLVRLSWLDAGAPDEQRVWRPPSITIRFRPTWGAVAAWVAAQIFGSADGVMIPAGLDSLEDAQQHLIVGAITFLLVLAASIYSTGSCAGRCSLRRRIVCDTLASDRAPPTAPAWDMEQEDPSSCSPPTRSSPIQEVGDTTVRSSAAVRGATVRSLEGQLDVFIDLSVLRPAAAESPPLSEAAVASEAPSAPPVPKKRSRVTPLVSLEALAGCASLGHDVRPGRNQHGTHWTCRTCSVHAFSPKASPDRDLPIPAVLAALVPWPARPLAFSGGRGANDTAMTDGPALRPPPSPAGGAALASTTTPGPEACKAPIQSIPDDEAVSPAAGQVVDTETKNPAAPSAPILDDPDVWAAGVPPAGAPEEPPIPERLVRRVPPLVPASVRWLDAAGRHADGDASP